VDHGYELEIEENILRKRVKCKTEQVEVTPYPVATPCDRSRRHLFRVHLPHVSQVHELKHSHIYTFRVRAVNKEGQSDWSEPNPVGTSYKYEKGDEFCTMKPHKKKNANVTAAETKNVCNACLVQ